MWKDFERLKKGEPGGNASSILEGLPHPHSAETMPRQRQAAAAAWNDFRGIFGRGADFAGLKILTSWCCYLLVLPIQFKFTVLLKETGANNPRHSFTCEITNRC